MSKDDSIYITHILSCLDKISEYIHDHSRGSFLQSNMSQDAVIRQLEIIGEATKHISTNLRNAYPDIPWKDMAGMRDKLIHDYIDVDLWVEWETAFSDVPKIRLLWKNIKF